MSKRHVLITGGAGYIGSHTAKKLQQSDIVPVVYDNLSRGYLEAVRYGPFEQGDLADTARIGEVIARYAIEEVIHFAAYIAVGESSKNPGLYFRNNTAHTLSLLEAMRDSGASRIVFSSTAAVYGDPLTDTLSEDHPHNPVSPYGESKLMVEKLLHWFGKAHGIRWAALRYFNAAGCDPDGEIGENHEPETHLIPLTLAAASGGKPLHIFGTDYPTPDGTAVRDYVHVNDLASAHLKALDYLKAGNPSRAMNLGTGNGYSVLQIIKAVEKETGQPVAHSFAPRREGDPPILVANPQAASRELGWVPQSSSLDFIVKTAWGWYRSRKQ